MGGDFVSEIQLVRACLSVLFMLLCFLCNQVFNKFKSLRSLEDIRKDILALEKETEGLLSEALK